MIGVDVKNFTVAFGATAGDMRYGSTETLSQSRYITLRELISLTNGSGRLRVTSNESR